MTATPPQLPQVDPNVVDDIQAIVDYMVGQADPPPRVLQATLEALQNPKVFTWFTTLFERASTAAGKPGTLLQLERHMVKGKPGRYTIAFLVGSRQGCRMVPSSCVRLDPGAYTLTELESDPQVIARKAADNR